MSIIIDNKGGGHRLLQRVVNQSRRHREEKPNCCRVVYCIPVALRGVTTKK